MKDPQHSHSPKIRTRSAGEQPRYVAERANLRQLIYAMEHYQSLDATATALAQLKHMLTNLELRRHRSQYPG
jgi:hypothetical protein